MIRLWYFIFINTALRKQYEKKYKMTAENMTAT